MNSKMGKLADYRDLNEVGRGTYGIVYKANCKENNQLVALKEVLPNEKEGFPIATLAEMQLQQNLKHVNIVKLLGICESSENGLYLKQFYLIFEFCDYDLKKILNDKKIPLNLESIKCIMFKILDGLRCLHDKWIIHRDLKPENILLTKAGEVKLGDFGLARKMDPDQPDQSNDDTFNYVTLYYRAPELLLRKKNCVKSIDVWSVGCIFGELWTRKPIIEGHDEKTQLELINKLCGQIKGDSQSQGLINYVTSIRTSKISLIQQSLAINFINRFLTFDHEERISVNDAIKSTFLNDYSSSALQSLFSNGPRQALMRLA